MTDTFLSRREAAAYFQEKYGAPCAISPKTLAKLAVTGGGPAYYKFGRRVGYTTQSLDAWAKSRFSEERSSTSDAGCPHAL